jgi:cold shock CspA family protein
MMRAEQVFVHVFAVMLLNVGALKEGRKEGTD